MATQLTNTKALWEEEREQINKIRDAIAIALEAFPQRQEQWEVEEYRIARERLREASMWLDRHDRTLAGHLASMRTDFGG